MFIQGDYVEVGVGPGGWYGTAAASPSGYHPRTPGPTLGFVSDPDKMCIRDRHQLLHLQML